MLTLSWVILPSKGCATDIISVKYSAIHFYINHIQTFHIQLLHVKYLYMNILSKDLKIYAFYKQYPHNFQLARNEYLIFLFTLWQQKNVYLENVKLFHTCIVLS